jgi:hypothetical protein
VSNLKDLHKFEVTLDGDIEEIIDNPREWAEQIAEREILKHLPLYTKAFKLGEEFANEIVDKDNI